MLIHKKQLVFVFCILLTLSFSCTKEKEQQQKPIEEEEYAISSSMEEQIFSLDINYDSLYTVVDQLIEKHSTIKYVVLSSGYLSLDLRLPSWLSGYPATSLPRVHSS